MNFELIKLESSFKILPAVILLLFLTSCSSGSREENTSKQTTSSIINKSKVDSTYGYTESNPIKLGGFDKSDGPKNEKDYINNFTGPNGEKVRYKREGSCCRFKTDKVITGIGLLDIYEAEYDGMEKPVTL